MNNERYVENSGEHTFLVVTYRGKEVFESELRERYFTNINHSEDVIGGNLFIYDTRTGSPVAIYAKGTWFMVEVVDVDEEE